MYCDNKLELLSEWNDELMGTFQENNSFGIALFSESGELLCANSAMSALSGQLSADSLINPTFEKLASNESTEPLIYDGLLTIGDKNKINSSIESKVFRRDKMLLITGGINVSQLIEQNKTMHFLNQRITNLQRQLTKEKTALSDTMDKLQETQSMLIQSEKMNALGQLVAGVAHEINNPIAYVFSNVHSLNTAFADVRAAFDEINELIRNSNIPELLEKSEMIFEKYDIEFIFDDFIDMINSSKDGLSRVKSIVEDLRKFSRHDEATYKNIDLISNIKSTIAIALPEINKRKIEYDLIAPESLYLDCYPSELNQVILNLLINSAQAINSDNGKITIEVANKNSFVEIIVSDNGIGIPNEIQQKIFDPFFTTKSVGSGTGLGLSIAYKIISDLHKGTITVNSEINNGTTFTINLPKK